MLHIKSNIKILDVCILILKTTQNSKPTQEKTPSTPKELLFARFFEEVYRVEAQLLAR